MNHEKVDVTLHVQENAKLFQNWNILKVSHKTLEKVINLIEN